MKERASRNRTIECSEDERVKFSRQFLCLQTPVSVAEIKNKVINQNLIDVAAKLPSEFVDLMILDPPYNLTKDFDGHLFKEKDSADYINWFNEILGSLLHVLKPQASVYVCSDWRTSTLVFPVLERHFQVRNRITWEREKGRGAKTNWKNNTEDIWFCTYGNQYTFNVDAVKLRRKVIAPYRSENGDPKDWNETATGNFRDTHPSNLWSDITIPFWSMPENTDHPTQKPEKLIAKLILASSQEGDIIFDPFLGSGTSAVVAQKLGRDYCGIEQNSEYCCLALKRLSIAKTNPSIQGYSGGVFWERNSLNEQKLDSPKGIIQKAVGLFDV